MRFKQSAAVLNISFQTVIPGPDAFENLRATICDS